MPQKFPQIRRIGWFERQVKIGLSDPLLCLMAPLGPSIAAIFKALPRLGRLDSDIGNPQGPGDPGADPVGRLAVGPHDKLARDLVMTLHL